MACDALSDEISERTHAYLPFHVNKSDIAHMRLKQQQKKNTETTFASPPRRAIEKKNKVENNGKWKVFCVTRKRKYFSINIFQVKVPFPLKTSVSKTFCDVFWGGIEMEHCPEMD